MMPPEIAWGVAQMTAKIVLLEDDNLVTEWVRNRIADSSKPETLSTEQEFREWIAKANRSVPYIFILDLRVRWTRPTPDMDLPPAACSDPTMAGVRCLKMILEKEFSRPEIIIFSIHAGDEWRQKNPEAAKLIDESHAVHLSKTDGLDPLMDHVNKAVCRQKKDT